MNKYGDADILTSGMRAGDNERNRVIEQITESMAAGRIDQTEADRRIALALNTRQLPTTEHINYLTKDLPPARMRGSVKRSTWWEDFLTKERPTLLAWQLGTLFFSIAVAIIPWVAMTASPHVYLSGLQDALGSLGSIFGFGGVVGSIVWLVHVWD
jgi:hypothetical protein